MKSCPTLCDPMDCSLPCCSVHGIFQAIVLERIAISFSSRSSQPRESNPGLPHYRQTLYSLSYQGSPKSYHVPIAGVEPGRPGWRPGVLTAGPYGKPIRDRTTDRPLKRNWRECIVSSDPDRTMWLVPSIWDISVRLWVTRFRWELISCSLTALPADEGKTRSQARFCSTHSCWNSFLYLLAVRHNTSYSQACKLKEVPALSL